MKDQCVTRSSKPVFVFVDAKSRVEIKNPDRVEAIEIQVDGCEITDGLRCDYLLLIKNLELFIELKGSDVRHAFKQLEASMQQLGDVQRTTRCYVACTRSPLCSTEIQHYQKQFRKDFRAELIIKSSPISVSV